MSKLSGNDFPHLAADLSALTQYLQGVMQQQHRGVNLLIYGPPGTGKTAFAKVLSRSAARLTRDSLISVVL